MVKDAEAHAEEDRQRREEADIATRPTRSSTDREAPEGQGDKISVEEKEASRSNWPTWGGHRRRIETIKTGTESLMTASQEFTQKLYEQAAANDSAGAAGGGAGGASAPNDDDVVDAAIVDDEGK
jgi:molecular chaperone DnaK